MSNFVSENPIHVLYPVIAIIICHYEIRRSVIGNIGTSATKELSIGVCAAINNENNDTPVSVKCLSLVINVVLNLHQIIRLTVVVVSQISHCFVDPETLIRCRTRYRFVTCRHDNGMSGRDNEF